MAIKLDDLKQRVAAFQKQAADLNPADPTEKGKVSAPKDPVKDPKLPEKSNTGGPEVTDTMETKPAAGGANAKTPKDGNAEDKQMKSASDRLNASISKLKEITKKATGKVEEPKPAKVEEKVEKTATENTAPDATFSMGPEALAKLASAIFETQEGVDAVLPLLKKKAGQEAAISLLKAASDEYENQVNEYREMQKYAAAAAEQNAYFEALKGEIVKSASSQAEADLLIKCASNHIKNLSLLETELEKAAYDQSVADAGEMVGAVEEGGEPALAGADGAPTIEQILMLLEQAVASGEISEEDAIAIAQSLMGEEGGEGAPMEEAPVEEIPAEGEVPMEEEMPKEASAKTDLILKVLKSR